MKKVFVVVSLLVIMSLVGCTWNVVDNFTCMVQFPSAEDQTNFTGRYYSMPEAGGPVTVEWGAWVEEDECLKFWVKLWNRWIDQGWLPPTWRAYIETRELVRVEAYIFNPADGSRIFEYDGNVDGFLALGEMLPGDYNGPQAFKVHMTVNVPSGLACYYGKLIIYVNGNRVAHSDMRLYVGGFDKFVEANGFYY